MSESSDNENSDGSMEDEQLARITEGFMDSLEFVISKKAAKRQDALAKLQRTLKDNYLEALVDKRSETLVTLFGRGLSKDPVLCADCLSLVFLQLGESGENLYPKVFERLITVARDVTAQPAARAACAIAMARSCFLAGDARIDAPELMTILRDEFFSKSTPGGLRRAAVEGWGLLLTVVPPGSAMRQTSAVGHLKQMLSTDVLPLQKAAGQGLILLCEALEDSDSFDPSECDDEAFKFLAKESNKHKSKEMIKSQHAVFRSFVNYFESSSQPSTVTNFCGEQLSIEDWITQARFDNFQAWLDRGLEKHLSENLVLRDIFELGPVVQRRTLNKSEKHVVRASQAQRKVQRQRDRSGQRNAKQSHMLL